MTVEDSEYQEIKYSNGFYKGFTKRGTKLRNGKGVMVRTGDNPMMFEGWWKHGKRDGFGRHYWAKGDVYDGEWKD